MRDRTPTELDRPRTESQHVPKRLYKYRPLVNLTLDLLINDKVFFAAPQTFNDPMDSRPSLKIDVPESVLEEVLTVFVKRRVQQEMKAAAKTIRYRGPKTMIHIDRHSQKEAEQVLALIAYNATNPDYDDENAKSYLLADAIEDELLQQYDKGIVALAERAACPLMWSHYGDQHHGVCIGYSIPSDAAGSLHKVRYRGGRLVEISKIAKMLKGDAGAQRDVDEAVLLRKAPSWRYEREWRLIGARGLQRSPLELEEVIFGIRCLPSVQFAVVKALTDREQPVKFYEMHEIPGTFRLQKRRLDTAELCAHFPQRSRSILEAFSPSSNLDDD